VVGGQRHAPAALLPEKTRRPLYRRPGGPQGRFGRLRKISPTSGFDPRTVKPVASRYTDCAISAHIYYSNFFLWRCDPTRAIASSFLMFLDHTQRRTTVGRTPLDEWSARRKYLYQTTHNTHNRQISMPPGGIRTHDLSRRAAADLRLRPRGHWDRQCYSNTHVNYTYKKKINSY